MISQVMSISSSLLPEDTFRKLELRTSSKHKKLLDSSCQLVVGVVLKTIEAIKLKEFKKFDSNPMDFGCQNRALVLRSIDLSLLQEEINSLEQDTRRVFERYKESSLDPVSFFNEHLGELKTQDEIVFKKITYLLHSYVLTVVRKFFQKLPSGVVVTTIDPKALKDLIGETATTGFMQNVVKNSQRYLSNATAEYMREEAEKISLDSSKSRIVEMISEKQTHRVDRRTFLCFFYAVKTMLVRLREELAPICIKSIGADSLPICLFLQPIKKGGEFQRISSDNFSLDSAIVFFEIVLHVPVSEFERLLDLYGFSEIILHLAACEPAYEQGTDLFSIQLEEARNEVLFYKEKGGMDFCQLDHIYLDQLANKESVYEYR